MKKQKVISVIFFAFLFWRALNAQVSVSIPDTSIGSNTPIVVPINVTNLNGLWVITYEFTLIYDSEIVTALNIDTANTVSSDADQFLYNISVPGKITVTAVNLYGFSGGGVLLNLEFFAGPTQGISLLTFDHFLFNEGDPAAAIESGSIAVDLAPVPVELASFTHEIKDDRVELYWTTATESNNFGFEIERSSIVDENSEPRVADWETIDFVKGNGTTVTPHHYQYTDLLTTSDAKFRQLKYRLKQINNDGTFDHFPAIYVNLLPLNFSLQQNYPNPFNATTNLSCCLPFAGYLTLKIYDNAGREIMTISEHKFYPAGQFEKTIALDHLPSGIYFYRVNFSGEKKFEAVRKMLLIK